MKTQFLSVFLSAATVLTCAEAAPAPEQLAGRVLEVNFRGALCCEVLQDRAGEWQPAVATPLVVQFPQEQGREFYIQLDTPLQGEEDLWPPNRVSYAPQGAMAVLMVKGRMLHLVLTLNFHTPESGTATLNWSMDESAWLARGATFRLRDARSSGGRVVLPLTEADSGALQTLDDRL